MVDLTVSINGTPTPIVLGAQFKGDPGIQGEVGPAGTVADFSGTLTNTGGNRLTRKLINTAGTARTDAQFREYFDTRTSNVPADPIDDIVGMGFNVDANGAQLDTSKTSFAMQFERYFAQSPGSTDGGSEWFTQLIYPAGRLATSDVRRVFGFIAYHGDDASDPTCTAGLETTNFTFSRYSDKALVADFNVENADFDLKGTRLRWSNNAPMLMALTDIGNQQELARFGTDNAVQWGAPVSISAPAVTMDVGGRAALVSWACPSGLGANDTIHAVTGPSLASFYHYFQDFTGESTAGIANRLTNATGPAWIEVGGTSQAGQIFTATYGTWCAMGVHNASNEFRITAENNLTSEFILRADRTTKKATFGGDITVPTGKGYQVNGTQVVGAQGAAIADATDAATAITQLNALLAACRTHGLIAT